MTIRRLTDADWAVFRDIRLEMLTDSAGAFGSSFADWAAKSEAEVREWLGRMYTLGGFGRRDLLATASYSRGLGSGTRHRAEVIAVYTRAPARGQGLQRALLSQMAADARTAGIVQLELQVAVWNAPAIAVYEKVGFERCGTIPRALCHNGTYSDDQLMVWRLDG